ncbi:MAG: AAA family ATPase [Mesorhizobium sp.]
MTHRIVLTGGPGAGKTTLIDEMTRRGLPAMAEAGRGIIRQQVEFGGNALPWGDRALFAELMFSWELRSFEQAASHDGPVLFDRGIPDVVGYLRLSGLPVPDHMMAAARRLRYASPVFILPHWPEVFTQDEERRQDDEEAQATWRFMLDTYRELGYSLVDVPQASISERADFVMARLADAGHFSLRRQDG